MRIRKPASHASYRVETSSTYIAVLLVPYANAHAASPVKFYSKLATNLVNTNAIIPGNVMQPA